MYTYKIEQAIKAASLLHQDQLRKGEIELPFITHLMSVMMILRDYTTDEDILSAAILHDTIEDTDYTLEELENDFGKTVATYVAALSEPRREEGQRVEWLDAKKEYAKQVKKAPPEVAMISAADKIHNFRSIIEEYYSEHNRFLKDFGPHLDSRIEAYQSIANTINNRLSDGIVHEFNKTFDQFKEFIYDVQETIDKGYQE